MSGRRLRSTVPAVLRSGARAIGAGAVAGAVAGALWAIAASPEYRAQAGVVVTERSGALEAAGVEVIPSGSAGVGAALELAASQAVADEAAGVLGGDVAGADLRSTTTFSASSSAEGVLLIRSRAATPDLAAAAADAFSEALIAVAADAERRRLERVQRRLGERLAALDPASPEALALADRLAAVAELDALGDPLAPGARPELPTAASGERSVPAWAAAGLGGGALVVALWLLGAELTRRPMRRPAQFEEVLETPVLAELSPSARVQVRPPAVVELPPEAAEQLDALVEALHFGDQVEAPRTIAVTAAMPQVGKSGVALGLGTALTALGAQVILIEANMRDPVLAERLGIPAAAGLAEYLDGSASPRQVMRSVPVTGGPAGAEAPSLVCVPGGVPSGVSPSTLLASARFRALIERLRRAYDVVIFDTPALSVAGDATAVAAAVETTVICARRGASRPEDLATARERLRRARLTGVVLTEA